MELLIEKVALLWQPPTFPLVTVMAELLVEWQASRHTILVVSPHAEELSVGLANCGFKVVKLCSKTEDKQLAKNGIVVSSPTYLCCDLLRNYAYSRVLVESAQAVSEVSLFSAIVKDCEHIWLMGDPYLPRAHITSQYCSERGMHISLFERMI
jgi:hypothetical protein